MIWLIIYVVGLIIAAIVAPKLMPYEEGMWRIEYGEAHPISEEEHKSDNVMRVLLWPLLLAVFIILLPCKMLTSLCNLFYDKFNRKK